MSWTLFRAGLVSLLLILPALSVEAQPTAGGLSARLSRLPPQWLSTLQQHQEISRYREDVLHRLIGLDFDGNGLDEADIGPAERSAEATVRSRQLAFAYSYDLDGDGRIALSEARKAAESEDAIANSPRSTDSIFQGLSIYRPKKDPVDRMQRLDLNGDDIVDFDEARHLAPTVRAASIAAPVAEIRAILAIDPTRDRRIIEAEMTQLADLIFGAFDWDADGKLGDAERRDIARYLPPAPEEPGVPLIPVGPKPICYDC